MKQDRRAKKSASAPSIYSYSDPVAFLRDWLDFKKKGSRTFKLGDLVKPSGLSIGYLSMVFNGKRPITRAMIPNLAGMLGLSRAEEVFFESLLVISTSQDVHEKSEAYDKIQAIRPFQRIFSEESDTYEFLRNWYYVAIREMAALPDFRADPAWIKERLMYPVSDQEVSSALEFLLEKGLIEKDRQSDGYRTGSTLNIKGGMHRLASARFHKEMFDLAIQSIDAVEREDRNLLGFTIAVNLKDYETIKAILDEAQEKISKIAQKGNPGEQVVHVALAAFPLTKKGKKL